MSEPVTIALKHGRAKRTPETDLAFQRSLEGGSSRRAACAVARVDNSTFLRWIKRYEDFAQIIARAEALAETKMASAIMLAAKPRQVVRTRVKVLPDGTQITETTTEEVMDWRAAAYWLTMRRSQDWAKGNLSEYENMTNEELVEAIRANPDLKGQNVVNALPS